MTAKAALLSYSLGTGHKRAAELLAEELSRLDVECGHSALEEWVTLDYDWLFRHGYLLLALHFQWVWDWMYASPFFSSGETLGYFFQRRREARRFERQGFASSDVVVATQYNAVEIAADWKKFNKKPLKLAAVITDFDIYPLWARREVDLFLVAHEELKVMLEQKGIPPERITVTGLPIDPEFEKERPGETARAALGLPLGTPLALIMGGGLGNGPMEESVHAALQARGWSVVAVCGKNEKLRRRLKRLAQAEPQRLRVLGYRMDLPALMAASDVIVTKGGALSLAESLASGRAVVAMPGLPGQERANIAFMEKRGWVTVCREPGNLGQVLNGNLRPLKERPFPKGSLLRAANAIAGLAKASSS